MLRTRIFNSSIHVPRVCFNTHIKPQSLLYQSASSLGVNRFPTDSLLSFALLFLFSYAFVISNAQKARKKGGKRTFKLRILVQPSRFDTLRFPYWTWHNVLQSFFFSFPRPSSKAAATSVIFDITRCWSSSRRCFAADYFT